MKYVYAVMSVIDSEPALETHLSDVRLTGKQVLDEYILTEAERERYAKWNDGEKIIADLSRRTGDAVRIEIQEVEVP